MYQLNEEQARIVERVRQVAAGFEQYAADVDTQGRFPSEAIGALGEAGLLGLTVPAEFGGMGQGLRVACATLDEVAQRDASAAMVYLMHLCGVACYAAATDTGGPYLREAVAGRHLSTLAWSEKGSRSHFWAPTSQAVRQNGGVRISAEKSFVTSAGMADGYVVSTRSPNASSPTDSVLYLVLKDDAGLSASGSWQSLGLRGNASAPMSLREVELADSRALCPPGKGFEFMLGVVLPQFQLGMAAISAGIAEAAVRSTISHLTGQRFDHLDSKLADLPNLRARLARMRIETDRSRALLVSTLNAVENPGPSTMLLVLESKAAAAEAALNVTDLGMKTCGGAAFGKHLSLERHFRDSRAADVMAPTTDVLHEFIGRALCGMELF